MNDPSLLHVVHAGAIEEVAGEQWLIRDLWAREGVGILGGRPKSCKTAEERQDAGDLDRRTERAVHGHLRDLLKIRNLGFKATRRPGESARRYNPHGP